MKLGQELPDDDQLCGNRGDACGNDRPDDQPLNVHQCLPPYSGRMVDAVMSAYFPEILLQISPPSAVPATEDGLIEI